LKIDTITIDVDTSELDKAVGRVKQLCELIREIKRLKSEILFMRIITMFCIVLSFVVIYYTWQ